MTLRQRQSKAPPRRPGPASSGFSLIELMIVLVIISGLLALLVPTISGVVQSANTASTSSLLTSLAHAAGAYAKNNNDYFPGQRYAHRVNGDGDDSADFADLPLDNPANPWRLTGTQWLSLSVFTSPDGDPNNFPEAAYMDYRDGMFMDPSDVDGLEGTIADTFPDPLPVCYYPCRRMYAGKTAVNDGGLVYRQYRYSDNKIYTEDHDGGSFSQVDFSKLIAPPVADEDDPNLIVDPDATPPYRDGQFLLIAPGRDRQYFTADDITNF
jgi:prepilin-type N-terminal cleavage/methylation domain-containing protein